MLWQLPAVATHATGVAILAATKDAATKVATVDAEAAEAAEDAAAAEDAVDVADATIHAAAVALAAVVAVAATHAALAALLAAVAHALLALHVVLAAHAALLAVAVLAAKISSQSDLRVYPLHSVPSGRGNTGSVAMRRGLLLSEYIRKKLRTYLFGKILSHKQLW